jgi:DNA-binding transcriptional regulator YdaS (Cro superfamily)
MAHPLKTYRARHDLSLRKFAELVGRTPAAISRVETGAGKPSPELAMAIERATGGVVKRSDLRADLWGPPTGEE